jgi:hypothetical protein
VKQHCTFVINNITFAYQTESKSTWEFLPLPRITDVFPRTVSGFCFEILKLACEQALFAGYPALGKTMSVPWIIK